MADVVDDSSSSTPKKDVVVGDDDDDVKKVEKEKVVVEERKNHGPNMHGIRPCIVARKLEQYADKLIAEIDAEYFQAHPTEERMRDNLREIRIHYGLYNLQAAFCVCCSEYQNEHFMNATFYRHPVHKFPICHTELFIYGDGETEQDRLDFEVKEIEETFPGGTAALDMLCKNIAEIFVKKTYRTNNPCPLSTFAVRDIDDDADEPQSNVCEERRCNVETKL